MIHREEIISTLADATKNTDYVHAMWLEGSEPQGFVDEYSDIDIWFSVDDDRVFTVYEEIELVLEKIATIDFKYVVKHEGELGHTVYHLQGTNEFLTIDINTQGKSRNELLVRGIDDATVIFDKSNVVRFKDRESQPIDIEAKRQKLRGFYDQILPSVLKSVRRNNRLEAIYYYHLILKYATTFLWLKHGVPEKKEFDLKHLRRYVSTQYANTLERFYDVRVSDIEMTLPSLREWIYSL